MRMIRAAVLLTGVVAGPPLYALVQSGDLDVESALLRGGLVLAACAVGLGFVMSIVDGYERDRLLAEKIKAAIAGADDAPLEGVPMPAQDRSAGLPPTG